MSNDAPVPTGAHGAPYVGGPLSKARGVTVLVAVLVVAAVALAGVALGHSQSSPKATITVTGSGTVQGTPDTLNFQVGVNTVASDAATALAENNARVASVESALLGHGVTRKELQTSGLDIYENTNNSGVVTGFTVDDILNVTMHRLSNAGAAIDAAAHAAGNGVQLYGITFSISNQSKLLGAARARAMQNARTEATQVASGGKSSVSAIVRITDQENSSSSNVIYPLGTAQPSASKVPIQAGSQSITVQVTVVYALNG